MEYPIHCNQCGLDFEATVEDTFSDPDNEGENTIPCPECRAEIPASLFPDLDYACDLKYFRDLRDEEELLGQYFA